MTYWEKILRFFTGDFCRNSMQWQRRYELSRLRTVYRVKMASSRQTPGVRVRPQTTTLTDERLKVFVVGRDESDVRAWYGGAVDCVHGCDVRTRGRLVGRRRVTAISQPSSAARTDSRYAASVILTLHGRHTETPSNLRIPYTLSVKDVSDSELAMESHNLPFKR